MIGGWKPPHSPPPAGEVFFRRECNTPDALFEEDIEWGRWQILVGPGHVYLGCVDLNPGSPWWKRYEVHAYGLSWRLPSLYVCGLVLEKMRAKANLNARQRYEEQLATDAARRLAAMPEDGYRVWSYGR